MAQARRTGQNRAGRNNNKAKKTRSSQQWGLIFIVLISACAIAALLFGYGPFGKGLKNYRDHATHEQESAPVPDAVTDQKPDAVKRTEKEFSFYNVLEDDTGLVLPNNFPIIESDAEKARKKYRYIMQLASFKSWAGAEDMQVKLAKKGISVRIEEKTGNFRLKMGPYTSRRKLKNERNEVVATGLGLNPIAIQYKVD